MGLRPGRTVRSIKRAYTRVSKRKPSKSYVVGVPFPHTHQFEMGTKGKYDLTAVLIAKRHLQLRDNSIEAARIVATKFLEKTLGTEFFFKILIYPHQIIREKPIAMGAGADRFSQGMRQSFGKPVGNAAQVKIGQRLMIVSVNKKNIEVAKLALKKVGYKISTTTRIVVEQAQS